MTGILLLYIGHKLGFPTLYMVGCWVLIVWSAWKLLLGFFKTVYEAGKEDGKS